MAAYDGTVACKYCRWSRDVGGGNLVCRRNPPQIAAAPLLSPTVVGAKPKVDWFLQAFFPPVLADSACGEFRIKEEIVQ